MSASEKTLPRLGLIGFGEVGQIFAAQLAATRAFATVSVWDIQFLSQESKLIRVAQQQSHKVCQSANMLAEQSDFIISAVTAANTVKAIESLAAGLQAHHVVLDLNSASPATKQQAAKVVTERGASYVEAGVMTSVPPYGISVPMVLGGPAAIQLATYLNSLGMACKPVSELYGIASAIKMCRSIMIKGLEALVIESYTAARFYGVEDQVLPTLAETFPQIDWAQQGAYFFSRVAQHGQRRSEEMFESASTVQETGFDPIMASAIARKHAFVAARARAGAFKSVSHKDKWQNYADALLNSSKLIQP